LTNRLQRVDRFEFKPQLTFYACENRGRDLVGVSEQQISEAQPAVFLEAGNFAVENGALAAEVFSYPNCKLGETAKVVSLPRNQFRVAQKKH